MVLGRRRIAAAVASVAAAIALAVAVSGRGCADADATPEGAVRAFVSAARAGEKDAAWSLLGPRTRQRLEELAVAASEKAGGPKRFAAKDMFDVDGSDTTIAPTSIRVVSRDGDTALVEIAGPDGRRDEVQAVRVDGRWRVELIR